MSSHTKFRVHDFSKNTPVACHVSQFRPLGAHMRSIFEIWDFNFFFSCSYSLKNHEPHTQSRSLGTVLVLVALASSPYDSGPFWTASVLWMGYDFGTLMEPHCIPNTTFLPWEHQYPLQGSMQHWDFIVIVINMINNRREELWSLFSRVRLFRIGWGELNIINIIVFYGRLPSRTVSRRGSIRTLFRGPMSP